jgi:DNA uptake protein ComE-like DNA-binding protein
MLAPASPAPAEAGQRSGLTASASRPAASSLIDINHCSVDELLALPGMTRVWTDRIVRFRPYRTKADLEDQGVIPAELYSRIRDSIIAHRQKQ